MSILIKGMEMPKSFRDIRIYADGRIVSKSLHTYGEEIATAIPVPPHGRLIDADALISRCADEKGCYYGYESAVIGQAAESASTVIPAEEGE